MDVMSDNSALLIADAGFGCIRRIDLASLYVSLWAGTCSSTSSYADGPNTTATFLKPTTLAITLDRGAVYVVDDSRTIRQIAVNSGGRNFNFILLRWFVFCLSTAPSLLSHHQSIGRIFNNKKAAHKSLSPPTHPSFSLILLTRACTHFSRRYRGHCDHNSGYRLWLLVNLQ